MNSVSTVTLQSICDIAQAFGDIEPILNVAQSSSQPALTICNDVMNAICAVSFPHKWNETTLPFFYTNSVQQDYALVNDDGSSVTNVSWLERGICLDINNSAIPKPFRYIECGRSLPQATGTLYNSATNSPLYLVNQLPNYSLYFGTWGDANTSTSTFGNNPVSGSVYLPLLSNTKSMPQNPIMQIRDANGNLLVLKTSGTEGTAAPVAPSGAAPGTIVIGTGATTSWIVVDPQGIGCRILPPPSITGVVWQFRIVAQKKPVRFTSLSQTLDPMPDEYEPHFRDGFIAQCYRYSPETKIRQKFADEWRMWLMSLNNMRAKEDREMEEYLFTLDRGIMGGQRGRNRYQGAAWPWNYPTR